MTTTVSKVHNNSTSKPGTSQRESTISLRTYLYWVRAFLLALPSEAVSVCGHRIHVQADNAGVRVLRSRRLQPHLPRTINTAAVGGDGCAARFEHQVVSGDVAGLIAGNHRNALPERVVVVHVRCDATGAVREETGVGRADCRTDRDAV